MVSKGLKERNLSVNGFKGLYKPSVQLKPNQELAEAITHNRINEKRLSKSLCRKG